MEYAFDVELSEREFLAIGKIVALWASLEYEIFCQTAKCCDISNGALPKEMNNIQFSRVLTLWETLVIKKSKGKRQKILERQYERICHYHHRRNALVHGMWDWSKTTPEMITAIRIRKKEIISETFTADNLESFVSKMQNINFKVRYPGGFNDFAKSKTKQGASISRLTLSLLTSNPIADELLRPYSVPAPASHRTTSKRPLRRPPARQPRRRD